MKSTLEITVSMTINVDGAPNAYGPNDAIALDYEANAHSQSTGLIVGYRTKNDDGKTPIVQGPNDPFPGFYISTTAYSDQHISNENNPQKYVNAAEINYVVLAKAAKNQGVKQGDFVVVHSQGTQKTVYGIVGDAGNSTGAEGSLALLQRLGYPFKSGKSGKAPKEIVVRYFAGSNPTKLFFQKQTDLEAAAMALGLDTDFSAFSGTPGIMVTSSPVSVTAPDLSALPPVTASVSVVLPYPGHIIQMDSTDQAAVSAIQAQLKKAGCGFTIENGVKVPLKVDGIFGNCTLACVELFQFRFTDLFGRPLVADGKVGPLTWGAIFGGASVPSLTPTNAAAAGVGALALKALEIAATQIGVLEKPLGSNRGPEVDEYEKRVGIGPGDFWCAAFLYWCYDEAAKQMGVKNPVVKTGGTLDHWNKAVEHAIPTVRMSDAVSDPAKIKPGMVFIYSTSGGHGHTGIVEAVRGGRITTIEGNTNEEGAAEQIGVFRRTDRKINSINRGFIEY